MTPHDGAWRQRAKQSWRMGRVTALGAINGTGAGFAGECFYFEDGTIDGAGAGFTGDRFFLKK
eukprot:CAMPEP_0184472950 /NCGR_PEP_ID=MMETSP0740-20130409/117617_1 /TAXON_ID=385413 /ORGANISM="Thalassiosira miniscula, Strain CCMP1093" /LENGTH=62 /DNA_ID=CAMNT_0026849737 /DNA_START=22 /DNA_END=208 /DNA_ORIENTATION=-